MGKQNKETELECAIKLANEYASRLTSAHTAIEQALKLLLDSAKPFDELRTMVACMSDAELPGDVQKTIHKILNLHAASTTPYDAACALLYGIDVKFTSSKGEQPEKVAA